MKKLFFLILILSSQAFAQEKNQYVVKNFDGVINVFGPAKNLVIDGYEGKDVIIEAGGKAIVLPEKAKGLKRVTSGGVDNTGFGVRTEEFETEILSDATQPEGKKTKVRNLNIFISNDLDTDKTYVIKVPSSSKVKFTEENWDWDKEGKITLSSLKGELNVNCKTCSIEVKNFSGNIVSSISYSGNTFIDFKNIDPNRSSYINGGGDIEILLPSKAKANLKMTTTTGNAYTDFDLVKIDKNNQIRGKSIVIGQKLSDSGSSAVSIIADTLFFNQNENFTNQFQKRFQELAKLKNIDPQQIKSISVNNVFGDDADYQINGGGVFLSIKTFNGDIYLRKKD